MQDWDKIKIVGNRKPPVVDIFSPEWDAYLDLMWSLRQDKTFIPRGVYKFKTFEEANEWAEKMVLGEKPTVAPPGQKI